MNIIRTHNYGTLYRTKSYYCSTMHTYKSERDGVRMGKEQRAVIPERLQSDASTGGSLIQRRTEDMRKAWIQVVSLIIHIFQII